MNLFNFQDLHGGPGKRRGRMAVLARCGSCRKNVRGVKIKGQPGCYEMECKWCGYSARYTNPSHSN